ncbi:ferredoxin reductase [Hydrocarboniphaga sp.]|uniref:ferredoxin reductase n=1 Tax=Hydrocarboniphaga sp. TaxID=2033016 RepID=UPI00261D8B23|nr:ferredoxin reductase [Hydrocarboniphaga sp.]
MLSGSLNRALGSRLVNALTAPHGVDRFLEPFNPMWSVDKIRARIESITRPTADSVSLRMRPNRHWKGFLAGQYVRVQVEIGGVRRSRCYSLSDAQAAHDGLIEITVKAQDEGLVSAYLNRNARVGMVIGLSQAEGEFVLPQAVSAPLMLIAGGSGITPIMAMLRTLARGGHAGVLSLLYYVRNAADTIFADELIELFGAQPEWKLRVIRTRESGGSRFGRAHLDGLVQDLAAAEIYVCGPAALIDAVSALCAELGCESRLRLERFTATSTSAPADPDTISGELRFVRSERYAANDGRSLLDQAEAAGLRPESGCRMGICHSCTCRKTSGVVRDLRSGRLSSSGEEDIQICVSAAVGDVTLDI